MEQIINWLEIPATNIGRAKAFYQTAFGMSFYDLEMNGMQYALAEYKGNNNTLALVQGEGYNPSQDGAVVYLNAGPDMTVYTDAIAKAGGQVLMPKTFVNEQVGHIGFYMDTEGNKIGLHHM